MNNESRRRVGCLICGFLALLMPLCAQEPTGASGQHTSAAVTAYESTLQSAVRRGMDRFVRSAAKAIPGFQATPAQSEAEGIRLPIPNGGLVFVIRVQPIVSVRSAAIAPPPTLETKFDPRVEYLACLRDALLDALLGESGGLPLNDAEWLTVVVTEAQKLSPEQVRGRKLYLAIKASDLSRLRRGQISTAAARMLVKVALEFD